MADILIFVAIAIIVVGIGLSIINKDISIFGFALLIVAMVLFLGYMFITTSW